MTGDAKNRTRARVWLAFILIIWSALAVMRITGPTDLMENDQEMPASYVMDAHDRGNWLIQHDFRGDITSKPPFYTWLAAAASLPFDHANEFSLYVPTALAALGVALIIFFAGRSAFGMRAGALSSIAWLLSPIATKHIALARTDMLFACWTTLAAVLAYRAWTKGSGWAWFWLAASAATLTKGPTGIVIALAGLFAVLWERRRTPTEERGRFPFASIAWFPLLLILFGAWFWAAYMSVGTPLVDRMLGRELLGHAIGSGEHSPGAGVYKPTLYLLSRFMPWSIFAAIGVWRVFAHPANDRDERRFERFATCWIIFGLVMFSIAAKKRPDHILPLVPAAALLAGRELERLTAHLRGNRLLTTTGVVAFITLSLQTVQHHVWRRGDLEVSRSIGMQGFAEQIAALDHADTPIMFVDAPFALQFYLHDTSHRIGFEEAADLLSSDTPVILAVRDLGALAEQLYGISLHEIARWPEDTDATWVVRIISNRAPDRHAGPDAD